jgi:hypothetical protein
VFFKILHLRLVRFVSQFRPKEVDKVGKRLDFVDKGLKLFRLLQHVMRGMCCHLPIRIAEQR